MSLNSEIISDVQADKALIKLSLQRVGVSNIPKIIRRKWKNSYNELSAKIDVYVDLVSTQRGIHMSRNIEAINEVTAELLSEVISDTEVLCSRIAKRVIEIQDGAKFSEVRLEANYEAETFSEPLLKKKSSVHKLKAGAKAEVIDGEIRIKKIIGAEVQGTTVCPCSEELSRDFAKEQLKKKGYTDEQINEILDIIPLAAHNQRSKAILLFELPDDSPRIELDDIIALMEISMSAPIHEVLKRKDEQAVVLYAHKKPGFVEDVIRTLLQNVVFKFEYLPDEVQVYAKQINYESIHQHDAVAEVCTTIGDLKKQLLEEKNNG